MFNRQNVKQTKLTSVFFISIKGNKYIEFASPRMAATNLVNNLHKITANSSLTAVILSLKMPLSKILDFIYKP